MRVRSHLISRASILRGWPPRCPQRSTWHVEVTHGRGWGRGRQQHHHDHAQRGDGGGGGQRGQEEARGRGGGDNQQPRLPRMFEWVLEFSWNRLTSVMKFKMNSPNVFKKISLAFWPKTFPQFSQVCLQRF